MSRYPLIWRKTRDSTMPYFKKTAHLGNGCEGLQISPKHLLPLSACTFELGPLPFLTPLCQRGRASSPASRGFWEDEQISRYLWSDTISSAGNGFLKQTDMDNQDFMTARGKGPDLEMKVKQPTLRLSLDPEAYQQGSWEGAGEHITYQGALISGPNLTCHFTFPTTNCPFWASNHR